MSACQAVIYRRCSFCFFSSVFFFWCFFWHTSVSGENLNRRVMLDTTPVSQILIYDTAPCLRHTPRVARALPRLFWHGVEHGSYVVPKAAQYSTRYVRVRVHRQNIQTGAVNGVVYDTGVANVHDTAARSRRTLRIIPRKPRLRWHFVGLATIEATVYPRQPSTRRDPPYPRAPAE